MHNPTTVRKSLLVSDNPGRGGRGVCLTEFGELGDEKKEAVEVQGKVKWFNNSKGYGFIGRDDGPDVFVHYSAVVGDGYRSLQEGDSFGFENHPGPQGSPSSQRGKRRGVIFLLKDTYFRMISFKLRSDCCLLLIEPSAHD